MIVGNITININKSNIKHFKNLGYDVSNGYILVNNFADINKGSHEKILCRCDKCNEEKKIEFRIYYKTTKSLKENYYCKKCSFIKNKKTNLLKYGVEHPMKNKVVVKKLLKTNNDKYGCNSASMLNEYKNKNKETNLKKYNTICPLQNKDVIYKTKETNILKYGVEHHNKNTSIYKKIKITKKNKYNNENYNNIEKIKKTNEIKYGYDNPMKNMEIINKVNKTKSILLMNKYPNIKNVDYNQKKITMLCDNGKDHIFEINLNVFQNRKKLNTTLCTICNNGTSSGLEIQLSNFIKENYNNRIIHNNRTLIGKEIDIYLPELNLAFEFNGLYWHNELNKENNYHFNKSNLCDEKGIQLIHIWEDDWLYKKDIVKSMILNKLCKINSKVYARKCKIKEISDNKLIRNFLENNHIQGFVGSQLKIGLFYENELVSLMTFGKPRKNMNSTTKLDNEYEMLRFCNKLNTNVIGGASKLFKYFLKTYNPSQITTYADRSYSNGNLYRQLGFNFIHITQPNYYYIINGIRNYRFGFRKDILVKQGFDKNKSEYEIMLERNIYRIYNAGNYKFIYKIIN